MALLDDFVVPIVGDEKLAPGTLFPQTWHAFTVWERGENVGDDEDFVQRNSVVMSDGSLAMQVELTFRFGRNYRMRCNAPVIGFPIHLHGSYALRLELRRASDAKFTHITDYPIRVLHVQATSNEVMPVAMPRGAP